MGYGAHFSITRSRPPREVTVLYTDPGSPAATPPAGLERGAELVAIDGVDVEFGNDVDTLNEGLFPTSPGAHRFTVRDYGSEHTRTFDMTAQTLDFVPVQRTQTFETEEGKVGYVLFTDHLASSESLLVEAFNELEQEEVTDLVLDLRYNAGGFLRIASQVAYMITGPELTTGKTFANLHFNNKHPLVNPVTNQINEPIPFINETLGYSTESGLPLPSLSLERVYILTSGTTCSASESIMNGLIGADIEVIQVGNETCGKPYGFYATDNCGTTYFTIQFRVSNDKEFGEFQYGFRPAMFDYLPGCFEWDDDFSHELGDPNEKLLATALAHRTTGLCTTPASSVSRHREKLVPTRPPLSKPDWLNNMILTH